MTAPRYIAGVTTHARRGAIKNAFRYSVDYVLIDPDETKGPLLFSRNGWNLASVHDRNHGGAPGKGRGAVWAREVMALRGLTPDKIELLTQPRFLGAIFNPVSFWFGWKDGKLRAVIAEVNNTFGDRHSYFCANPGFGPIAPSDQLQAEKLLHVSPFQEVEGIYQFNFTVRQDQISIRIAHQNGDNGVIATLIGQPAPLTNRALLRAIFRRPLGTVRTWLLIHWQALKLKSKGARYKSRPTPPNQEVS